MRAAPASMNTGSFVDASGYKHSEKDTKIGKIKLKKNTKGAKAKKGERKREKERERRENSLFKTT